MQGKGIIKFFAILLGLVSIYYLSFTWVAQKVESDAREYAKGNPAKEKAYLDSVSDLPAYPVLGHTYQYCKDKELALGLDLKGGMNVTMQVSLRELVKALSNDNPDAAFNKALADAEIAQKSSQKDYITLFVEAYEKSNPGSKLAAIFATRDNQANLKYNASNAQVKAYLQDQANAAVKQAYTVLDTRINQFGVVQPNIQLQQGSNRILIELPGVKDPERVRKLLQGSAKLEFYKTYDNREVYPLLANLDKLLAAKQTSTTDTAKTATAAATDTAAKKDNSLLGKVEKSAAKDTTLKGKSKANANPLFSIMSPAAYGAPGQEQLAPGAVVGLTEQKDTAKVNAYLNSVEAKSTLPKNLRLLWGVKPREKTKIFELYAIKLAGAANGPVLSGDVITDARDNVNEKGDPEVSMSMNSDGAAKWRTVTAEAAASQPKQSIAIVLDNIVYSAPTVQNEISGGVSSISGSYTQEDTKDLSNVLKAGRLKAPARIVNEAIVGPSLGQEAISAGLLSCILGFVVVLVFMVVYYNRAGTVAVVAVLINVFFLMGVLVSLGAVLTLPGIAGIVLTLGIAVDANVLVYERVREEMALGKSLKQSISDGFKHALSSILDANVSTFLTATILLIFGSGPIKGFATTLMIGIITSLFCSLLISRVIFEWMLDKGWDIKFSYPWSSHTFKNARYAFVKNRFKFYAFSAVFIIAGLISIFTQGFNYGVDFQGGYNYIVEFEDKNITAEQTREAVVKYFGVGKAEVKTFGADKLSITTNYNIDDKSDDADAKVETALRKGLDEVSPKYAIGSRQKVDPTISNDLKTSATLTVIFAILVIAAYILIRFRKWQYSLGALIATAHDALLVLSFFSLFKDVLPFSLDIDQAFIAAVLTVIGYSINDTVVVMDRIREFLAHHNAKGDSTETVINTAINSTLSRTIITSLTVLFVLIVLFIFGGDVIRGFSFALLIGITFGTYSSICVATPVIVDFGKKGLK
ncbi:protein translocase subunit SecDF [Mucilaginibacter hurinus]|uniref:Multifunctional fusion protein n=1 Tax=Mucilaginibacter hurinus TaxID=2201324 RepID=A0A367GSN2_9SPHI|nr:protein translocase subunit SecDF [Mucilaginibacter hurinus]RCH56442.1 protein translocase subunit SecDF [Mucilaginibacter hurinus]